MKLSPAARDLCTVIRRHRLTYSTLRNACHEARKHLSLHPPHPARRLPKLIPESSLQSFFSAVDSTTNLQHQLLLRLLLYTAVRVSELTQIRISDVDLQSSKIFILQGKGDKDRYVLFPDSFRIALRAYILSHPSNEFLFESTHKRPYTPTRIRQIMHEYQDRAGIDRVHPHLFRHQALTFLTKHGIPDSMIQLISGHATRDSLEIYQHMALGDVNEKYQEVMKKIGV